jgi:drug/metabolite transporter (DMT)-like permease
LWAVIFWGFSFIATRVALREVHPFTLLTLRFGIGGFLLLLIQLQRDRGFLKTFSSKDWVSIVFLSIVGISGHTLLQAYGLLYTTAVNTGWIVAVMPIFITIAARFYLGEAITLRKAGGIVLGFLGIFLVISQGVFSLSTFRFGSTFGDILVLISAITWTAFTVGGRGFLSRFSPLAAITPIMIVGCLITLPFTWLKWEWNILFHLSLSGWMGILFLGVFCSGLAYLFWYSALEKKDSGIVGIYLYLEPLVTLIGASFLLNEEIQWVTLVGGGMILLGVYLATREFSSPSPRTLSAAGKPSHQGGFSSEIKILTSKLISDIKCRCKDRLEKEGNDLGSKRCCEVV